MIQTRFILVHLKKIKVGVKGKGNRGERGKGMEGEWGGAKAESE